MEQRLVEKFGAHFKPVDKRVKEEELLLFLDKRTTDRFDRETFAELKGRLEDRHEELTPRNFAKVYHNAYERLEFKAQQSTKELNGIDKMAKLVQTSRSGVARINFTEIEMSKYSDSSNYLSFEMFGDFTALVYSFTSETSENLFLPQSKIGSSLPLKVSLFAPNGDVIDSRTVPLSDSSLPTKLVFRDSSTLEFHWTLSESSLEEMNSLLTQQKTDIQNYQLFLRQRKSLLTDTFKDVYLGFSEPKPKRSCSTLLLVTSFLTMLLFFLALFLNFTRCMFIDIFLSISFFGNMYIWRNYNLLLGLKFIGVLVVSIIMDTTWEILKILHFTTRYEATQKSMRIKGLVLNGLSIFIKVALIVCFYLLSRENQSEGFFALDDEASINEVNEDEYLMRLPVGDERILK